MMPRATTIRRLGAILVLAALGGAGAAWVRACLEPPPSLLFTWEMNPDLPLGPFADGRLGALQPRYARSYLVVAYRCLMGRPLSAREREEALDLWERRLGSHGSYLGTSAPEASGSREEARDRWLKARSAFLAAPPPPILLEALREGTAVLWESHVQPAALDTAVRTLQDRARRWGRWDVRLKAWIRAQDQVFASIPGKPSLPAPLEPAADPLLRQDREYQIASARFYGRDLEGALAGYQAIAGEAASPWRATAAYMVARTWYRKGLLLQDGHRDQARQAFEEAMARANACADATETEESAEFARRLRWEVKDQRLAAASPDPGAFDFDAYCLAKAAAAKADPLKRTRELAALLSRVDGTPDFGLDLGDYTILLDRQIQGEMEDAARPSRCPQPDADPASRGRTLPAELLQDDLTDWVFSFRAFGHAAYVHALERWSRLGTVPWLLSALANAEAGDEGVEALLAEAARLPVTHPGHPMAALHLARLQLARRAPEAARAVLDGLVDEGPGRLSPSAFNLAKALRMPLARTEEELLRDLQRTPVGVRDLWGEDPPMDGTGAGRDPREAIDLLGAFGMDRVEARSFLEAYPPGAPFLQEDGAGLLNLHLPTEALARLARMPGTAPHLRREWLRCAWVRAVLLGRLDLAATLSPEVRRAEPRLEGPLSAFEKAPPAARDREALWILLRHPGLRWFVDAAVGSRTLLPRPHRLQGTWDMALGLDQRDPYRNSWWGALSGNGPGGPALDHDATLDWALGCGRAQTPAFLDPAARAALAREREALKVLDNGPAWLCARTARWAREDPGDPRLPEALHRAVRASRVDTAGPAARECFRILHTRFKDSPWAARTPFYY